MTKQALIMIDYINDIIHPDGKIASCAPMIHKNKIIAKCNKTLKLARKKGVLIIWIKVAFSQGYPEIYASSPIFGGAKKHQALLKNSWGTELITELDYKESELIIYKNRISPFYATNLELILNSNKIQELYVAGVATQWAVEAAARDAHDRNFQVMVLQDLCASGEIDAHNATLKTISRIATILNSPDVWQK